MSSATRASRKSCREAPAATRLRRWTRRRRSKMRWSVVTRANLMCRFAAFNAALDSPSPVRRRYASCVHRGMPMIHPILHLEPRAQAGRPRSAIGRALAACADLIMPPCCLVCRTPLGAHHLLCPSCWRDVNFIRPPLCDVLGIPLPFDTGERTVSAGAVARPPAYDRARAVAHYSGSMRTLVHQLKYADRHDARTLLRAVADGSRARPAAGRRRDRARALEPAAPAHAPLQPGSGARRRAVAADRRAHGPAHS